MNKGDKFNHFLDSLKNKENSTLIESVKKGFKILNEGIELIEPTGRVAGKTGDDVFKSSVESMSGIQHSWIYPYQIETEYGDTIIISLIIDMQEYNSSKKAGHYYAYISVPVMTQFGLDLDVPSRDLDINKEFPNLESAKIAGKRKIITWLKRNIKKEPDLQKFLINR